MTSLPIFTPGYQPVASLKAIDQRIRLTRDISALSDRRDGEPLYLFGADIRTNQPGLGRIICGTRVAALAPLAEGPEELAVYPASFARDLASLPASEAEIVTDLRAIVAVNTASGLKRLRVLSGYRLDQLAKALDRLRQGGSTGALIAAVAAAIPAARDADSYKQAWTRRGEMPAEMVRGPALLLTRALLDCLVIIKDSRVAGASQIAEAGQALITGVLHKFNKEQLSATRRGHTTNVLCQMTRALADLALGRAADRTRVKTAQKLLRGLDGGLRVPRVLSIPELNDWINALIERTQFPNTMNAPALAEPCSETRSAALHSIDTSELYSMLMTRRLREALERFPWMRERMGAFAHMPLGLLGAMSQIFELARAVEIARELLWRQHEPDASGLTRRMASKAFLSGITLPSTLRAGVAGGRRLGTAAAEGAVSSGMVQAIMKGACLAPEHPLIRARFGHFDHDLQAAFADNRTVETTGEVEQEKYIHGLRSPYEDAYPRYYGNSFRQVVYVALDRIFLAVRCVRVEHDDEGIPKVVLNLGREIVGNLDPSGIELRKFDGDRKLRDHASSEDRGGSGEGTVRWLRARRQQFDSQQGSRLFELWQYGQCRDDAELLAFLTQPPEPTLCPVGDLFHPALWFTPDIDLPFWTWMQGRGDIEASPLPTTQRDRISAAVAQWQGWAPRLYHRALPSAHTARMMCVLSLAPQWLSLDHAFVEIADRSFRKR